MRCSLNPADRLPINGHVSTEEAGVPRTGVTPHFSTTVRMGIFDLTDTILERAMSGSELRQSVLANNLANANTPGFKRSDVDFQSTPATRRTRPSAPRPTAAP